LDAPSQNELFMSFICKSFWDHVRGFASLWRTFLLTALGVFGVIWTCFEAPSYFLHANLSGGSFYVGAIAASIIVAGGWTAREYLHVCPPGFERESKAAQRIAHLQRPRWEHALARQLLRDVLLDIDEELAALSDGRVFVLIEQQPSWPEYIHWVGLGPDNALRMVQVASQLIVSDLPLALGSAEETYKPQSIRKVIYRIRDLYRETVAFERSRRAVQPPEGAERLHNLQLGWTDPIRNAVKQLFEFFDEILSLPSLEGQAVSFTVTIDEPENLSEFLAELSRLQDSWPQALEWSS